MKRYLEKMGTQIEYDQTDEQNIEKLHLGRIDLVVLDEAVGHYLIRKLYPGKMKQVAFVEKPLNQDSLHLMLSRTYPGASRLERQFADAFKRIKKKGIYEKICSKYGVMMFRSESLLYLGGPNDTGGVNK